MGYLVIENKKIECKSILISRNKNRTNLKQKEELIAKGDLKPEFKYVILIKTFKENDPHMKLEMPINEFEFENISKTKILNLEEIDLLTLGSDLLINNIKHIEIKKDGEFLIIKSDLKCV